MESSEIIALVVTITGLVANGIVIFFLVKERKSKNRIIEDFKILIDTTDIKRLADYYKSTDELKSASILAQTELIVSNWFKERDAEIGTQFDELASFAASLVEVGKTDEEKLHIININFPHCLPLFEKYLSDNYKKSAGLDSTS